MDQKTQDYIAEWRKARDAEREDFERRLNAAGKIPPADYTRLRQVAERSGLPLDVVRRNREEVEKKFPPIQLNLNNAPQLRRLLDGDDESMVYVGNDATNYGFLEEQGRKLPSITLSIEAPWYKGNSPGIGEVMAAAWNNGQRQNRINALRYEEGVHGADHTEEIVELNRQMHSMDDVPGYLRPFMHTTQQLTQQLEKFTADVPSKAAATMAGMAAGAMYVPPVGPVALFGKPIGAAVVGAAAYTSAATASSMRWNYRQAFGEAYGELLEFSDHGFPLSGDTMRGAAHVYAAVSAGLELPGLDLLINTFPGGKVTKKSIATMLKGETGRQVLARWAKGAGKVAVIEGATEVAQEGLLIGIGAAATQEDFGKAQYPSAEDALGRLAYSFEAGFWAGGMIGGAVTAPGAAGDYITARSKANGLAEWWDRTTDILTSMKNFDEDPDAAANVMANMADNDAIPDVVYVPAEQITAYFQSKGLTEEDIAQIAPGVVSALQEAYETDTDAALTLADIRRIGGPTREFYDGIAEHIKATRGGMSLSEVADLQSATKEMSTEYERMASSQEAQSADPLYARVRDDMLAAGYKKAEAEHVGALTASVFNTRVKRNKMTISPIELYERFNVRYEKKRTAVEELLNVSVLSSKIEAIKAGRVPSEREVMGPSVLEFMQDEKVAPHSDLIAMDLNKWKSFAPALGLKQKPFMAEGGRSLDDIYIRLQEEGYPLPPQESGSAEQLVIAAIQEELEGRPVRPPAAMNEALANIKADFDELSGILEQSGLDWQNMPSEEVAEQLGIQGLAQAVSTRWVTGKNPVGDSVAEQLVVTKEVAMTEPDKVEKNIGIMLEYDTFSDIDKGLSLEEKLDIVQARIIDNLVMLYEMVPEEERAMSKLWYDGGREIIDRVSLRHDANPNAVAAVVAALSPQKDWFQNVTQGERVVDIWYEQQDTAWSDKMTALAKKLEIVEPDLSAVAGKKLSELTNDIHRAMWIRAYDEAHNPKAYRSILPTGDIVDTVKTAKGKDAKHGWGAYAEIAKGVSALRDDNYANVSAALGKAHKVRNFYNNLLIPNDDRGYVTMDTHAIAAALFKPLSGESWEVKNNFGGKPKPAHNPRPDLPGTTTSVNTGLQGTYWVYQEAYQEAARRVGVLPREMQSITWEAVRTLFDNKSDAKKDQINRHWEEFASGQVSYEEARDRAIAEAGGRSNPGWFGKNPAPDARVIASTYRDGIYATPTGIERRGSDDRPRTYDEYTLAYLRKRSAAGLEGSGPDLGVVIQDSVTYFQDQYPGAAPRGMMTHPADKAWFKVSLMPDANASTLIHESGHLFLELLNYANTISPTEETQADMATILNWFGIDSFDQVEVKHHEMFAEGFEQYMMHGKAPSLELRDAFIRFQLWMTRVYKSLKQFLRITGGEPLSGDITRVFDRMLATDEQMQEAAETSGLLPAFTTAEEMGVDADAYEQYRKAYEKALDAAIAGLQREVGRELYAERRAEAREYRERLVKEVTEEVNNRVDVSARHYLWGGQWYGGEALYIGDERRVNLPAAKAILPHPRLSKLIPVSKDGGFTPDEWAMLFGYQSGKEFLEAVINAPKRQTLIDDMVSERFRERYDPDAIVQTQKQRALHTTGIEAHIRRELAVYDKKVGGQKTLTALIKDQAQQKVRNAKVRELRPGQYYAAEQKARRAQMAATASKDWAEARKQARLALYNHYAYRYAKDGVEKADKMRRFLAKVQTPQYRGRVGKASQYFLTHIDTLLENASFKKVPIRQQRSMESVRAFVEKAASEDLEITIPMSILEAASLKNWQAMTLSELTDLHDAVKNIYHLALHKERMLLDREKKTYKENAEELALLTEANWGKPAKARQVGSTVEPTLSGTRRFLRRMDASLLKMEYIVRFIDGGPSGRAHELLFRPFREAQAKRDDMMAYINREYAKIMRLSYADRIRYASTITNLDGNTGYVSDVIGIALNMGNASNKDKMMRGHGWTDEARIWAFIEEHLTVEDMERVQSLLDLTNKLFTNPTFDGVRYDGIVEVAKRMTGIAPPKVEPTPFTFKGKSFRGGYFPMAYDRSANVFIDQMKKKQDAEALFEFDFIKPSVPGGFNETRTKFAAPINLSLDILPKHLREVVHYITHAEAVKSVNKLTMQPEFAATLKQYAGEEIAGTIQPWLSAIAREAAVPDEANFWSPAIRYMRTGVTVSAMGLSAATTVMQMFGVTPLVGEVGTRATVTGVRKAITMLARNGGWDELREMSGEFRHLATNFDRDAKAIAMAATGGDLVRRMSASKWVDIDAAKQATMAVQDTTDWIRRHGFWPISKTQELISAIAWFAGEAQAIEQGMTGDEIMMHADAIMMQTQGGGSTKDLSAFQRGNDLMKAFYLFSSYFASFYGQERDIGRKLANKEIRAGIWRLMWVSIIPVILEQILRKGLPDEEEEMREIIAAMLGYQFMGIPILRDLGQYAINKGMDVETYPLKLSPLSGVLKDAERVVTKTVSGEWDFDDKADAALALRFFSTMTQLPIAKPAMSMYNTPDAYELLMQGEPADAARLMALGRTSEE